MSFGTRFYSPYINRFLQPDSIIPNPVNPQAFNRFSYGLNNPSRYTDPTGHMVDDESDGAGCNTPGSPKCILDKYYGVSTDNEWMMDMELYYYQQAYPEYDVNTDSYLDNTGKLLVSAPTTRAGCVEGSFWSCFAMGVMGGIGTTIAQPVIFRPAEPAPQNYGDYADPDCPGCGYVNPLPKSGQDLLDESVRFPGSNKSFDNYRGNPYEIFRSLATDIKPIPGKPGYFTGSYRGGTITFRPESTQSGYPTIDFNNVPGIPNGTEIKFPYGQ